MKREIKTVVETAVGKAAKTLFLFIISFFSMQSVWAGQNLSLDELLDLLEKHNPLLQVLEINRQIARTEVQAARLPANTEISLARGSGSPFHEKEKRPLFSAGFSWYLPNPWLRALEVRAAGTDLEMEGSRREIQALRLRAELTKLYHGLLYRQRSIALRIEEADNLARLLPVLKARVAAGEALDLDQLRLELELSQARTGVYADRRLLEAQKVELNELLGLVLAEDFTVTGEAEAEAVPLDEKRLLALAAQGPQLRYHEQMLVREKLHLAGEKAAFWPGLALFAEGGREVDARVWKVGLGLEIPLFSPGGPRLKKAGLQVERAEKELLAARNQQQTELRLLLARWRIVSEELASFRDLALEAGRQSLRQAEQAYLQGEIALPRLIDTANAFFGLQRHYQALLLERAETRADLSILTGE